MSRNKLLVCAFLCLSAQAQTRRALLVGIDHYAPSDPAPAPWKPTALRPVPLIGEFKQVTWPKLNGAVNDMKSMHKMLLTRGFKEEDIVELVNEQATGDAILNGVQKLIDKNKVKAGDSSLFYFAGHGARIINKHADLAGGYDVAIVPYDAPKGVPGLRGKELARIYTQVPAGVSLTVVQDNCFSATGARGTAPPLVTRDAPDDSRTVDDAWDPKVKLPEEQDNAVLVIAASQRDQQAEELSSTDDTKATGDTGLPHGRFTFALLQAMNASLPDESTAVLFQRARNYMHSMGTLQEPYMQGKGRGEKGLFGQKAVSPAAIVPMVQSVNGFSAILDHGQATGLREGCELVAGTNRDNANPKIRLTVTKLVGLDRAEATPVNGVRIEDIHEGDRFIVSKWTTYGNPGLSVYVPAAAPSLDELLALGPAIKSATDKLKLTWVVDATRHVPDFRVGWNGRAWELFRSAGKSSVLGPKLTAEGVTAALKGVTRGDFLLLLPPPAEWLRTGLRLGAGSDNMSVDVQSKSPASSQYMLVGTSVDDRIEYAWVAPNLTQDVVEKQLQQLNRSDVPVSLAMPLGTKPSKVSAGASQPPYVLTDQALRLAKVRSWLLLENPGARDAMPFPYHLVLNDVKSGEATVNGSVIEDQEYAAILTADPKSLDDFVEKYKNTPSGIPTSFVYVFVLDSEGRSTLVFPELRDNGVRNRLPIALRTAGKITLSPEVLLPRLSISPPFGVDSYVVLNTATALTNPDVLNFDGVGVKRGARGSDDPLTQLLDGVGTGSRGVLKTAPTDWSIQRTFIRSVAKQ